MLELLALDVQPALEDRPLDLSYGLRYCDCNPHTHQLLESTHIGNQICVQVVAVERWPEVRIVCTAEEVVEDVEFLDGLWEGSIASGGVGDGGWEGKEGVSGEKREAKREIRVREDRERLDEDVGDGLITGKVGVELISRKLVSGMDKKWYCKRSEILHFQIELIMKLQRAEWFKLQSLG
jgi:hypothetical protein